MATGRGLSRGLALGLQAAKQYSDREEAEKDRQLRKEMQEREMTDRQLGRDAAMEQLMARIAAGADSDDKKIQAAADQRGLTLESREEIARLGRLLDKDKLDQQDRQFWASLGGRQDEFDQMQALRVRAADQADERLQNEMNQFRENMDEQIRRNREAESQGRTRLYQGQQNIDNAYLYNQEMLNQGQQRLDNQARETDANVGNIRSQIDARNAGMYGAFHRDYQGLKMLDGQLKQEQSENDISWGNRINMATDPLEKARLEQQWEASRQKLQAEHGTILDEGRKQLYKKAEKSSTPTTYSIKRDFISDPDNPSVRIPGSYYITGQGTNYQEVKSIMDSLNQGQDEERQPGPPMPTLPGIMYKDFQGGGWRNKAPGFNR
jgi:hypothetical protein